ncbi:MAG: hypothetical protein HY744_23325 [Deltaproteobacteria bacterium]|nr:hypothetical protein [Deltaproteobacteria bacterium]
MNTLLQIHHPHPAQTNAQAPDESPCAPSLEAPSRARTAEHPAPATDPMRESCAEPVPLPWPKLGPPWDPALAPGPDAGGMSSARAIERFCPICGQLLVVPTDRLDLPLLCPRCRSAHVVGRLIDRFTAIPAIPLGEITRVGFTEPGLARAEALTPAGHLPASTAPRSAATERDAVEVDGEVGRAGMPGLAQVASPAAASPACRHPRAADVARAGLRGAAAAASVGREGAAAIGRAGALLIRVAVWLDERLAGWRAALLCLAAASVVVAALVDWILDCTLQPIALAVFAAVVVALLLARLDTLRDESGWRPELLVRQAVLLAELAADAVMSCDELPIGKKAEMAGKVVAASGLFALATHELLAAVGIESATMFWLGVVSSLGGLGLWMWGRKACREAGLRRGLLVDRRESAPVASAVLGLPALLDCRDARRVAQLASQLGHPLLSGLVGQLATWHPRGCGDEHDYQYRLLRALRRQMPEACPASEVSIRSDDGVHKGRIDLMVGECVLIEMKAFLTGSSADRAIGQVRKYLTIWQGRGPVVLLLCGTDPDLARSRVEPEIEAMRAQGHAVAALLAAA